MGTALLPIDSPPGSNATISTTTGETDRPDRVPAVYQRMQARWLKCRALMRGTEGVRELEEVALPRFEQESDDSYRFRLNLVAAANGFNRVVMAGIGMILQAPPKLGDDMPPRLAELWENIDAAGTHGDVFTRDLFLSAMVDGHVGILVDYPKVENPDATSLDDEQRLGLRPFWVRFDASDILLMLYETVNSVRTLTLLILREVVQRKRGLFGTETVTRYRIYSREGASVQYQVWEQKEGDSEPRSMGDPAPMRNVTAIPFAFFAAGRKVSPVETVPPLLDLADLNLEHFAIKTDIRNLETLACVPTPVRVGAVKDADGNYPPLIFGPRRTIEAPELEGVQKPVYWLTPDVTVLDPAMKTLANNEAAQGAAGLAFLTPETRAAETAEAKRIDSAAQNATLVSVARNGQDALETAFDFTGQYVRLEAGSVTLNTDFEGVGLDAQMVTALGTLAANGKLSIETLLALLEKGKILAEGFDVQAEVRRILTENALPEPTPTDPTADPIPEDGA